MSNGETHTTEQTEYSERLNWKCSTKDTLLELNSLLAAINQRLSAAEARLIQKKVELEPLEKAIRDIRQERNEVGRKLNNWWREYRDCVKSFRDGGWYKEPRSPFSKEGGD